MGRRHVEHAAVRVLDRENLAPGAVDENLRRTDIPPYAVVYVHHVLARLEVLEVGEARSLRERRIAPGVDLAAGEDAVRLRHDDEPADLETAREVVRGQYERPAPPCRGDVLFEALARGVEELRMVRLVGPKLCEARKGRRLEVAGGDAARRRVAREDTGCKRAGRQKGRDVVVVVLEREQRAAGGDEAGQRLAPGSQSAALGGRQQLAGVYSADGELRRRVEGSQALQLVAEELGADRELVARAPCVDDAAPDRTVAFLFNER